MKKRNELTLSVILVPLIAVAGYGLMHSVTYLFPGSASDVAYPLMLTIIIITLGLTIPYFILKLGVHVMHLQNRSEPEVRLKNIAKPQKPLRRMKTSVKH